MASKRATQERLYPTGGPRAHFDSSTNHTPRLKLHFLAAHTDRID